MSANAPAERLVVDGLNEAQPVKRERHPAWYPPQQMDGCGLRVMNSLTDTVEPFAPRCGRLVKWYICGPTVYDVSHMGHARAYLTFDILRRIMEDYFGYEVLYQMNITDIDDKIIKRARINTLLEQFHAEASREGFPKLQAFTAEAIRAAEADLEARAQKLAEPLPESANSRVRAEREEKLMELSLKQDQLGKTKATVAAVEATHNFQELFDVARGVNGDLLDVREGHKVTDQRIFDQHARKYERSFFEDIQRLGVREPDVITRVSEYVPQIVRFIEKIFSNGFAYVGSSSVFFDTEAYVKAGHAYPKLKPGGDKNATEDEMAEGEGALSKGVAGEKRSPNDFALWKFSKPGEPRWPSPWGEGRPGWHIECSVMASDVLGENMDIHSGGGDLRFPHHDNECAQSEACNAHHQWVNYFLHCGHLHIKGLKMSKSLKNFITIQQALGELGVTPRTMRLLFLANAWHRPMNFSDQSLDEAKERERVLRAFFGSVDVVLRQDSLKAQQGLNAKDRELLATQLEVEQAVHAALQDNYDTPTALTQLLSLVASTNQYLLSEERPSATLVRKVGRYITRILQVFGVVEGTDAIGFSSAQRSGAAEDRVVPVMDALTRFRDHVRATAKATNAAKDFLPLCDQVRDEWLVDAGIRLEDKPNGPTTWKNDDPALLRAEIEARRREQDGERAKKLANQAEVKRKLVAKWTQFTTVPAGIFAARDAESTEKKYAAFDEATGLPTTLASGEPVGEKEIKRLSKELAKYTKSYEEFIAKGGRTWLDEQTAELERMEKELSQ